MVWMKDLETGRETALTATPAPEAFAILAPDGARVAFVRAGDTYVLSTAGGIATKVCEACGRPEHWSPDGKRILLVLQGALQITVLHVATGQKSTLAEHPKQTLYSPRFSPDGRWVAFHAVTGPSTRRIFVIPYRDAAPVPESEWIPATDGSALDRDVCWSPDGGLLYFQSERDGSRCIWAQRLDAATKRPAGEPFPVVHFHHARRSLAALSNASLVGLSAVPGRLILSFGELTGNIWMLEPRP